MAEKSEESKETEKARKRMISSYYKINEAEGLKRLRPFCARCGPGYFMADHGDRYTCGRCGFTKYKHTETKG